MTVKRILIIEDDLNIAELERDYLQLNGFKADIVQDGAQGLSRALTGKYDVVIVDLMLPGKDGYDIIKEIRKRLDVTVVVVSAKSEDISKIRGVEYGADDYLTKPFGIEELLARIRVALRHAQQTVAPAQSVIQVGPIAIDLSRHIVTRDGEEIRLTATEFKLLAYLAANADRVLTHQAILTHVWDFADADRVEYLRVYIGQLRRKLERNPDDPVYIRTESGVGYRLVTGE